jgi:hypothetical protein
MLVSPVSLHLQSILHNVAYFFLESNPAIHLSAETPVENPSSDKPQDIFM